MLSKKICSVVGCEEESFKTMSRDRIMKSVNEAGLKLKSSKDKKAHFCKAHWKVVKKYWKKENKTERIRFGI